VPSDGGSASDSDIGDAGGESGMPVQGANSSSMVAEKPVASSNSTAGKSGGLELVPISGGGVPSANRKITFSASYTIKTKSYDEDYASIDRLVREAEGYIADEKTIAYPYESKATKGRSSQFTLKIPADGYTAFLDKLAEVGEVADKNKSSEDMSDEYFDTESRIEVLKMRRDRLTGYIKGATKSEDIVQFEKDLAEVLLELDQYEGRKRKIDQLVSYATISVSLDEKITAEVVVKDKDGGQSLGNRASDAFSLSATGIGKFLQNILVFFAGAAPTLVFLAVIVVAIWFAVKGIRRVRTKRNKTLPEELQGKHSASAHNAAVVVDQDAAFRSVKPEDDTQDD
jgi:hypothetical protein